MVGCKIVKNLIKIGKKVLPKKLWSALRFLKNNRNKFGKAKIHFQEYGILQTLQKTKALYKKQQLNQIKPTIQNKLQKKDFIIEKPQENKSHLKIAVVIHVFYLDKVEAILNYISNIPYDYSLYFSVSDEKKEALEKILHKYNISAEIILYPNQGYDIAPFIYILHKLQEKKYDLICKIHTKKGSANLENHLQKIEDLWFNLLLNPILGSSQTIEKIIYTFQTNKNLGMLSSAELLKSAQKWMYGNETDVSKILNILNIHTDPAQEWGFNAGSIFWARMDIFQDILKKEHEIQKLFSNDLIMKTGSFASSFHAMERVFGLLPKMRNMKHAISYATDIKRTKHIIQFLHDDIIYASNLGVGYTLENEYYINKNHHLLSNSSHFDEDYYTKKTIETKLLQMDPLLHFLRYGLYQNKEPKQGFLPFTYFNENPHLLENRINPLIDIQNNNLIKKKTVERKTNNTPNNNETIKSFIPSTNIKRICLFAAYDKDGLIDESVLVFIKELNKHADVYFLSDSNLQYGELNKLKPYTEGAWGIRHGEYDFGSYKRLAKFLVGWETIEKYDEVMLVNDSSYLLKPLDNIFTKMNTKKCSWWGLQATKGMYHTQENPLNQFKIKIPIKTVKEKLLKTYKDDKIYDFHIASYFLVFRKPILKNGVLQSILNNIKKETSKKEIILKYEIGLTKTLLDKNYEFDTYMDDLYPFHPIYTETIFEMIENGFPLFKRFYLTENHYHTKELWRWKEKLLKILPNLDINPIEKNLHRIADASKLYNNLHISNKNNNLLSHQQFTSKDKLVAVNKSYWIFPVCAYDHNFTGNERAIFEEVKNIKSIKKIILIRSKYIKLDGENVTIIPLFSREAQEYLLASSIIFIKHSPKENTPYPLDPKKHKFINVWHGIPLKRIGAASLDLESKLKIISKEHQKCHSVIASSSIDRMAMTSAFYPLTYKDIWVTGLPRNDFILREQNKLPNDFQEQIKNLETIIGEKKFILYAPTFRNKQADAYYSFSLLEKETLHTYFKENNIIFGIREHMADKVHSYNKRLKGSSVIDVGSKFFPNIEILYRKADILITDYSSCFIDFMLTGKPMISFAYDYKNYSQQERGLFYDLKFAFAGNICQTFDSLYFEIKRLILEEKRSIDLEYNFKRKLFFDYIDDKSSTRLVERLKKIKD